jgi:hypothetical protein
MQLNNPNVTDRVSMPLGWNVLYDFPKTALIDSKNLPIQIPSLIIVTAG